jgi:hypothetical protein
MELGILARATYRRSGSGHSGIAKLSLHSMKIRKRHDPVTRFNNPLLFLLPTRNRVHILGDLEEEYRAGDKRFSRLWYWGQVLALIGNYWWAALRRLAGLDAIRKLIRK